MEKGSLQDGGRHRVVLSSRETGTGDIHTQVYAYDSALSPNMYGMCPLCSAERVPSYLSTLRLRTVSLRRADRAPSFCSLRLQGIKC